MVLRINTKILDFIEKSEYDNDIKQFLIASIILEEQRYKASYARFADDYDEILNRFIK